VHRHANWILTLISKESTLLDAIRNLDRSGLQISLVVDENGVLVGTLTDGDIRRAILRDIPMDSPVKIAMNPNAIFADFNASSHSLSEIFLRNGIDQIPLVDSKHEPVGLVSTLIKRADTIENIFFILAGGKGTRLLPYTEAVPKPMLEINGKPILEHIIAKAALSGFQNIVISIGYLGHMISDYFGDGSKFDLNIRYVEENFPLGTAGPISLLQKDQLRDFIVVCNGDVLSDVSFEKLIDFHKTSVSSATMVVRRHELENPFGVVETNGENIVGIFEKPKYVSYINAGIYVIGSDVVKSIPKSQRIDMTEIFEILIHEGMKSTAFPIHEEWRDVGRESDLMEAQGIKFPSGKDR
jgi:dTDP-glucose pyrophosphorylase